MTIGRSGYCLKDASGLPMDVIDQVMTRVRFATIGSLDRCLVIDEKKATE